MKTGIILGYFYGYGLIFCYNNKLRFFEIDENFRSQFDRNEYWNKDRKGNVNIAYNIRKELLATYEVDKDNPNMVVIHQRYNSADDKTVFDEDLVWYIENQFMSKVTYRPSSSIAKILQYVKDFDLNEALASYQVVEFQETLEDGEYHYLQGKRNITDDAYIKSLCPTYYSIGSNSSTHPSDYSKRLLEKEEEDKEIIKHQYSKEDHLRYLLFSRIDEEVKENEVRVQKKCKVEILYPYSRICEILNRVWPHMSAQTLCRKYNNEFDGNNVEIFGKKRSSKRKRMEKIREYRFNQYLKRKKSLRDAHESYYDPESEVMDALENGNGDYFGY